MTSQEISELKIHFNERAEYYSRLGFDILSNEYSTVVKILAKFEDIVKEKESAV